VTSGNKEGARPGTATVVSTAVMDSQGNARDSGSGRDCRGDQTRMRN
jgi:hypothetical protein